MKKVMLQKSLRSCVKHQSILYSLAVNGGMMQSQEKTSFSVVKGSDIDHLDTVNQVCFWDQTGKLHVWL